MRRRFFLLAAPAIVAAPSLMKVSALAMPPPLVVNYGAMDITPEMIAASLRTNRLIQWAIERSIYPAYDGYEIVPNDWERAALVTRGAQSA